MIRKSGYCNWPPAWTTPHPDRDDKPKGEVGTLEDAVMSELIDNKIFLFIRHEGFRYMGVMAFDDRTFCREVWHLLREHRGKSIEGIGDLDLSCTLWKFTPPQTLFDL